MKEAERKSSRWLAWGVCVLLISTLCSCQQEDTRVSDKQYVIHTNLIAQYPVAVQEETQGSLEIVEGKIRQPIGTTLTYYTWVPQKSLLHLELSKSHRKLSGRLEVSTDTGTPEIFDLAKQGTHNLDLSHLAGKIVRLCFQAASSKSSSPHSDYIEWGNMTILSEKPSEDTKQSTMTMPESEAFQDYDVVYLLLDAFHAEHASVYGYARKTTPFFEELAQEAVVFENMFANVPYTLASTATLFTSKYPDEHGLIGPSDALNRLTPTLSELLEAKGIKTFLVTRHGYLIGDWGLSRGFSTIYKDHYGRHPEKIFDKLEKIYTKYPDERKFIYIHLGVPHSPYNPPEEFRNLVLHVEPEDAIEPNNKNLKAIDAGKLQVTATQLDYLKSWYDANVLFADHIARQIFDDLKERGVLDKTIFIITSDHGEAFLQHGQMLHNSTLFDEMVHIPLIIRFPKDLQVPAKRLSGLASIIDLTPTLATIYGLDPLDNHFSGTNLLPLIFEETPVKPFVYLQNKAARGIRDLAYKYIAPKQAPPMLFDLQADPAEQTNLYEQLPVTARYYQQLVRTITAAQNAASTLGSVDLNQQSEEVLQNLKELGYIN